MSEPTNESHPKSQPLTVLPNSGKVEQLRKEAAEHPRPPAAPPAPPAPAKHVDTTLVSRFADSNKTPTQKAIEEKVVTALRTIYDPEIPVNIYDLGLIYAIQVDPDAKVHIKMTLTAPACPVAGQLVAEVEAKVEGLDEVPWAEVELVWDPPWAREMMSEAAQLELGLL
jgi:FeS assembly SUF system protein